MADIVVLSANELECDGKRYPCATGKNGFTHDKREGDNCSPIGVFPLRECWFRKDKLGAAPETQLPLRETTKADGWCDDVASPEYNRHVQLPHTARHEKLWRDDDVYDVVVVIGYNDAPVACGKGSAIFMHVARPDYSGTEGCVALALPDLLEILPKLSPDSKIYITPEAL